MNSQAAQSSAKRFATFALLVVAGASAARGAGPLEITIEPDDYSNGAVLDNASPFVTLSTGAFSDNRPTFSVTAETDVDGASTGSKVFAHVGIRFWSTSRTFRMDFHVPVTTISLDYIASGFFDDSFAGRLEAYSPTGALLAWDETAPLADGQFETMTVSAPTIAYALAFPPEDPFGDLDHLRFTVVPEPQGVVLFAAAVASLAAARRSRPTSVQPRLDATRAASKLE